MAGTENTSSVLAAESHQVAIEASRRNKIRNYRLLSMPALIVLTIGAAGPLLIMLVYSFLKAAPYGGVIWEPSIDGWFGVFLKKDIFDGTISIAAAHLSILWRSVNLSIQSTLLALILGFPTAYFIATRPVQTRNLWLFLITIPFWTNLLIRTFAIMQVIRDQGIINNFLIGWGLIDSPIEMLYTDFAIMLGMTYVYLPLMVLPLYASIEKLDFRLVEAAYDLYATRLRVLWRIIIPLVRPGIVAGSILVFVPSLGAYVTPRVLGGGKHLMLGNLIELQFGQGRNWPLGAALSIFLLCVVMGALLIYVRVAQRGTAEHV